MLIGIPFIYWLLNNYFYADFAINGIPHRVGSGRIFPTFASRESLFGWISFFTATSMFMSILVVISLSDIVHWIYLSRNKS